MMWLSKCTHRHLARLIAYLCNMLFLRQILRLEEEKVIYITLLHIFVLGDLFRRRLRLVLLFVLIAMLLACNLLLFIALSELMIVLNE